MIGLVRSDVGDEVGHLGVLGHPPCRQQTADSVSECTRLRRGRTYSRRWQSRVLRAKSGWRASSVEVSKGLERPQA